MAPRERRLLGDSGGVQYYDAAVMGDVQPGAQAPPPEGQSAPGEVNFWPLGHQNFDFP